MRAALADAKRIDDDCARLMMEESTLAMKILKVCRCYLLLVAISDRL
jgi:hypothetical protein